MFIFDGAMGTMLQQSGLAEGQSPDFMNIENPQIVKDIHKAYLRAGANILTTNTFGACAMKLEDYALQSRVEDINIAAVKLAKEAIEEIGVDAKVAGDLGPTGKFIKPLGQVSFDEVYATYLEQATALIKGGADYLIIETIIDIQEMRAALLAAKDARENAGKNSLQVPIICQLSYSEDGRTITGTDPKTAVILLEAMGADIIGANCSLGPEQLIPIVEEMAAFTNLPISIQPNAGMPLLINKETVFPLSPEDMATFVPALIDAGANYVGGCCGTTPEHIELIARAAYVHTPKARTKIKPFTSVTSRTKTVLLGHKEAPVIIGERINPTGRKTLAKEIAEGSFITVKKDALAQVEAGAGILDVNMGVPSIDQAAAMEEAISALTMLVDVPLSIDTLDPKAMEAGLKAYPGRPLINSVNAEPEQMASIMPLAKRYGAALLCLPLSRGALPETAEDRCTLAKQIVLKAFEYEIRPQDLLLDPLVLTLAAGKDSARETLRTLKLYKEAFGYPTVMGLSNISFGLPQRPYINGQFLTMALANGLTTPIMNPLNYTVKKAFMAAATLLGYDAGAKEFIVQYAHEEENSNSPAKKTGPHSVEEISFDPQNPIPAICHAVEQGEKEVVINMVEQALEVGIDPLSITKEGLSEAMNRVGEKFGVGKVFLPQVMLSAEAMQGAFQTIKKLLPNQTGMEKETVVLATVKGDIHDLGKNIVAALLENNGYKIVDLGKDVDADTIVSTLKEHNAPILGLASLMTTTMPQIDVTIEAVRKAGLDTKIIVGGAVLTQAYADEAGADMYARDGINAVKIVNELTDNI